MFVILTGMTHKLERTPPQSELLEEHGCERSDSGTENDSGYLSDSDCDD